MYDLDKFIARLDAANIPYEKGTTGQYKGDFYISAGNASPHIHASSNGTFVGLKKKKGAMTALVSAGVTKREAIESEIDVLNGSTAPNDVRVRNALLALARVDKFGT